MNNNFEFYTKSWCFNRSFELLRYGYAIPALTKTWKQYLDDYYKIDRMIRSLYFKRFLKRRGYTISKYLKSKEK